MHIHPRSDWGARPPKSVRQMAGSRGVYLHYIGPAVPGAVFSGDLDAVKAFLRSTQNFHMGPQRGWSDIAYSFAVDRVGRAWELRGWGVVGGHTMNQNSISHAIVFLVGDGQALTPEAVATANALIGEHDRRYGAGFIRGHQQAPGASTSCPGADAMRLLREGAFAPGAAPAPADPNIDWAAVRRYAAAVLLPQVQALPTLRQGMRGGNVQTLQKALNIAANARLTEDGDYGLRTKSAVSAFQAFFSLPTDGIAGPKTLGMLAYCLARIKDGQ